MDVDGRTAGTMIHSLSTVVTIEELHAARAGGYIDGDIRISGHPKDQRTFARISGYVEQTDVHAPQVPH